MAINPLSVPNFSVTPYSGGADFSQLANLGNVYQEGQMQNRRLAVLGQLGSDPTQNAMLMIKSGDPTMAQQGINLMNQVTQQQRYAQELDIRQRAEKRAQETFEQNSPEYRRQQVIDAKLDPNSPEAKVFIATGQNFPGTRAGLGTPTYTRDDQGKLHMWQLSSTGQPVEVQFAPGQTPLQPGEVAAEKAQGLSMGKAQASAIQMLPALQDQTDANIAVLENLRNHPGRKDATGPWMSKLGDTNPLLGQQGIDFRNSLNQAKSQGFLEAYKTGLRGSGSISNIEGEKGTQAIIGLSSATSLKDFNNKIDEAEKYYRLALERTRRAAKGDFSTHPTDLRPTDYKAPSSDTTLDDIFKPKK
jgi:hypothetical protein